MSEPIRPSILPWRGALLAGLITVAFWLLDVLTGGVK